MSQIVTMKWDQSRFDAALKAKLEKLKSERVPKAINKTAFFVALKARGATPKKEPFAIEADVMKTVTATNKEGMTRSVPILWILAAKRVGKAWPEAKMNRGIKNKRQTSAAKAYLKMLAKTAKTILGSRKRASGFLRVGWASVLAQLAPAAGLSRGGNGDGAKVVGQMKGSAAPATAGYQPRCTITNSASAKSDRVNGLMKFGGPALQLAMAQEAEGIIERLDEETRDILNGKID